MIKHPESEFKLFRRYFKNCQQAETGFRFCDCGKFIHMSVNVKKRLSKLQNNQIGSRTKSNRRPVSLESQKNIYIQYCYCYKIIIKNNLIHRRSDTKRYAILADPGATMTIELTMYYKRLIIWCTTFICSMARTNGNWSCEMDLTSIYRRLQMTYSVSNVFIRKYCLCWNLGIIVLKSGRTLQ